MSAFRILYLSVLIGGLIHAQAPPETPAPDSATPPVKQGSVPEIAALRAAYDTAIAANEAERVKWLAGLENWYLDGLGKLLAERTKAGDLDGALPVKAERERMTGHAETTAAQIEAMPATLRTLRGNYDGALKKISDEIAKRDLPIGRKFLADLEALQKRITISGDLNRALLVKAEKERLAAQLAGDALASAALPPTTPIAPATPVPTSEHPKPLPAIPGANLAHSEKPNLLVNGNFQKGTDGWELADFKRKGVMAIDTNELHDGKPTLRVDNAEDGHSFITQTLAGKPYTHYRLTGFIKTKNVQHQNVDPSQGGPKPNPTKLGAFLVVLRMNTDCLPVMEGTKPWTKVTVDFSTRENGEIQVGPSLGYDHPLAIGTAWFSDLTLIELGPSAKK